MTLKLMEGLTDRIRAHAADAYPHECCGALFGRDGDSAREICDLLPLSDRHDSSPRNRFVITPDDFRRAVAPARALQRGVGNAVVHPARRAEAPNLKIARRKDALQQPVALGMLALLRGRRCARRHLRDGGACAEHEHGQRHRAEPANLRSRPLCNPHHRILHCLQLDAIRARHVRPQIARPSNPRTLAYSVLTGSAAQRMVRQLCKY